MEPIAEANSYERECMSNIKYYCNAAGESVLGRLEGFDYYPNKDIKLYGGALGGGTSYVMKNYKEFLKENGYVWEMQNGSALIFDELSSEYNNMRKALTYSDNTPRIEPSNLIMKLIGRI